MRRSGTGDPDRDRRWRRNLTDCRDCAYTTFGTDLRGRMYRFAGEFEAEFLSRGRVSWARVDYHRYTSVYAVESFR